MIRLLGAIATLAVLVAPAAAADPDPHMPDMASGYCPGDGQGIPVWLGYCDGVPYEDGSYWHIIQYGVPMIGHPNGLLSPGKQCVVRDGAGTAPAPPGGCGGAVPPGAP